MEVTPSITTIKRLIASKYLIFFCDFSLKLKSYIFEPIHSQKNEQEKKLN